MEGGIHKAGAKEFYLRQPAVGFIFKIDRATEDFRGCSIGLGSPVTAQGKYAAGSVRASTEKHRSIVREVTLTRAPSQKVNDRRISDASLVCAGIRFEIDRATVVSKCDCPCPTAVH